MSDAVSKSFSKIRKAITGRRSKIFLDMSWETVTSEDAEDEGEIKISDVLPTATSDIGFSK